RMIERREDLPLGAEALDVHVGVEAGAQQLERDVLRELPVRALGEEHARHSAAADLAHDAVAADPPPDVAAGARRILSLGDAQRRHRGRRCGEEAFRRRHAAEVLLHLASELDIVTAARSEDRGPLMWLARE